MVGGAAQREYISCAACGSAILGHGASIAWMDEEPSVYCADSGDCRRRVMFQRKVVWEVALILRDMDDSGPNWFEEDAVGKHAQRLQTEAGRAWRKLEAIFL